MRFVSRWGLMMTKTHGLLLAAGLGFILAGCEREATGQVAAVVNGEEITLQEINAEFAGANVPEGEQKKAAQQAALDRIVERRLLAQAARDDGIDKEPEFVVRERQLEDSLLMELLAQKAAKSIKIPDAAAIDQFVASHPDVFSRRTIYTLERFTFPMPSDPSTLKGLENDHTMDAVAARLDSLGIKFNRSAGQMDSAVVPPEMLNRIRSLPAGEPFLVPEKGKATVAVITGSKPAALSGEDARPIAVALMKREQLAKTIQSRAKAARASAEIKYQSGFAPAAPKGSNVSAKPKT